MGEVSTSNENKIICSANNHHKHYEYFIFLDSRGLMIENDLHEGSLLYKLLDLLNRNKKTYLAISRPKNLTVLPTLVNFLHLNQDIQFKYLITNLGFVDCTPKKQMNIDDILLQIGQFSKINDNTVIEHEAYQLNDGNKEILKNVEYSYNYLKEIASYLSVVFEKCYFINTPIVQKKISMKRKRPDSFYAQLHKTNEMIEFIALSDTEKNIVIDIKNILDTYDGVHYTKEGHKKIFNKIKESLEL